MRGMNSEVLSDERGWSDRERVKGKKFTLSNHLDSIMTSLIFIPPDISQFRAERNTTFSEIRFIVKLKSM